MNWLEKVKEARARGSFEDAMKILEQELALRPQDPQVHLQIGWTHDALGKESDAAPAYENAIRHGLTGPELKDVYLGLGSTYRCLGEYQKSKQVFEKALEAFPEYRPFQVFLSLTLYNLKEHSKSTELLLNALLDTTNDSDIKSYERALRFYADKLDQTFE